MKFKLTILIPFMLLLSFSSCSSTDRMSVESPNKKITAEFYLEEGHLWYNVNIEGDTVIEKSPLGLIIDSIDFTQNLIFSSVSDAIDDELNYQLTFGKHKNIKKQYAEQTLIVKNRNGEKLGVVCRVFDDGVAFAYNLYGEGTSIVQKEISGFKLNKDSKAFISPLAVAKSGWAKTNPSYEDQYRRDITVGTPSDYGQGWVFPALFKTNSDIWVLLSETGVDRNYVASHLADDSTDGLYKLEFPHQDHNQPEEPTTAKVTLPFTTPWRTITIGKTLAPIVESTMAQDLVKQAYSPRFDYKAGKSAWSWLEYGDEYTTYEHTKEFIDMAAALKFEYCLIDAVWDVQIGRKKIEELAAYASSKNVGLILWYNSNGNWNDAPQTPINIMNERESRRKEMEWMQQVGIKGIKVDFFGGDKQAGMMLYQDILEDANDFGISCNFHGCTLPRGWDRMFPNFVTAEAVMGMEFCMFEQKNTDMQPMHCATLPFTRNIFAPMDFTPTLLNRKMGHGGNSMRKTSTAFELALPVVFYSSIHHLGITPKNLSEYPNFVWQYLSDVPTSWDETKFLDGYPGKDFIVARRHANTWYIAGINGEDKPKQFSLDLSFVKNGLARLIIDKAYSKETDEVQQTEININSKSVDVDVTNYGGFILIVQN